MDISNNNGFLLFGIGNCKLKEGEIIHYFNYNITPIHTEYVKLKNITNSVIEQIQHNIHLEEQTKALTYFLNDLTQQIQKLFNKRNTRGLVNGLGNIIKSITGNLDQNDAEKYDNLINQLKDNQKILQKQNEQIIKNEKHLTDKFNLKLEQIKVNENKITENLNYIVYILNKEQNWKNLIDTEVKINKLLIIIQNLNDFCKHIELMLTICSLNKLDTTIINRDDLIQITGKEDIWSQVNEITTYCKLENEQIHTLLIEPELSQNSYPLYQLYPIPFIHNKKLYELAEPPTYYINKYNKNILIERFNKESNNVSYCQTKGLEVSNCINNIVIKENNDECEINEKYDKNNVIQIPNTNNIIIISPINQELTINCKNKNMKKKFQGIFRLINDGDCKINQWTFNGISKAYKELELNNVQLQNFDIKINKINLKPLQKLNISIPQLQKIKEMNYHESNTHHYYIIYIILMLIIFVIVIKIVVKYYNNYKVKKLVNNIELRNLDNLTENM